MKRFLAVFLAWVCIGCSNDKNAALTEIIHEFSLDGTPMGVQVVAAGLDVPWEICWGPDDRIWMTEQKGIVSAINIKTGAKKVLLTVPDVWAERTSGLLGMAVHPDFDRFPYVVLDYTVNKKDSIASVLVRYTYKDDSLINPVILLSVPGSHGHHGSRVLFDQDAKILWATGDAQNPGNAQNIHSLNGKILRINIDGTVPGDNPVKGSPVWAWGFRNMQGLTLGAGGKIYTSEHGDATDDEVNRILPGCNYGWPDVTGEIDTDAEKKYAEKHRITEPLKSWTPTIAPAGIGFYRYKTVPAWENTLLLTTLKENDLRVLKLDQAREKITGEKILLDEKYGRLRDLCISPAGDVYVSTSNRDWNPGPGYPKKEDDKILRLFRLQGNEIRKPQDEKQEVAPKANHKGLLYEQYCASCHKPDGKGVPGSFPPLNGKVVKHNKERLIETVLNGLSGNLEVNGTMYNQSMPSFSFLEDGQVAAILSYIRAGFGNEAGPITAEEVHKIRQRSSSKK